MHLHKDCHSFTARTITITMNSVSFLNENREVHTTANNNNNGILLLITYNDNNIDGITFRCSITSFKKCKK